MLIQCIGGTDISKDVGIVSGIWILYDKVYLRGKLMDRLKERTDKIRAQREF